MKYRNEHGYAVMQDMIRLGKGHLPMTLRQNIETTLGMHSMPEQLAVVARSLGLEASVDSAGNWYAKTHLITVTGATSDVKMWLDLVRQEQNA